MYTFRDIRQAQLTVPTALTIGNFDGIHLGHQALLQRLKRVAEDLTVDTGTTVQTGLLIFEPHPLAVLRPEEPNLQLSTSHERMALAAARGIDVGVIHPFTRETAALEPRTFVEMLKRHLALVALVIGPDFALGRNRAGNIDLLRALGGEFDFSVDVMEPIALSGEPVRSSRVRDLLQVGDAAAAARLLGRPYRVAGLVQRGDQRGRTVGIPTANVAPPIDQLLPADGVYVTRTHVATFACAAVPHYQFNSVTNVGVRPTVDGLHRRIETHLLDFPAPEHIDDLYGELVAVDFLARLRGEQRFANVTDLVNQIHMDIGRARSLFANGHF